MITSPLGNRIEKRLAGVIMYILDVGLGIAAVLAPAVPNPKALVEK